MRLNNQKAERPMILGYSKWKELNEQENVKWLTPTKIFSTPESSAIYKAFCHEFIPTLIPNHTEIQISALITKLKALTDEQLTGAIEFFKKKGYTQPGDPRIVAYQNDIMKSTDVTKFTSADNKSSAFNDGTFGAATAKATIMIWATSLALTAKKFQTLAQSQEYLNKAKQQNPNVPAAEFAPKMNTQQNVKLDVGTQKVQ